MVNGALVMPRKPDRVTRIELSGQPVYQITLTEPEGDARIKFSLVEAKE
jgi:hypothetical protein